MILIDVGRFVKREAKIFPPQGMAGPDSARQEGEIFAAL